VTRSAAGLEKAGAVVPTDGKSVELRVGRRSVRLTNLDKVFWPRRGRTKGDLLRYYATVSPHLLPHLADRAMVMKRYPHGIDGDFFFMKRAPSPRPDWVRTVAIEHRSGNVIDFPMVQDLASLLWVVNLGCIDLNQWYARSDDVDRPDYVHFDLDPTPGASFAQVLEAALAVRDGLAAAAMPALAKTTGSRGIHVYVPIVRGPTQKQVWTFAKAFSKSLAERHAGLLTSVYRVADRPRRHVLVDYNQNAWGRTLASVYSVRPRPEATVSTPVTWDEIERGIRTEDFTMDTVPERLGRLGDLFAPLLARKGRVRLEDWL
jgi:bifunctional non-homologous end joining protein LigD